MKVYQLVAVGHLKVSGERRVVYSAVAYNIKKDAKEAIPAFKKMLTIPKSKDDLNVMTDNPLRIFIWRLDLL